MKRTEISSPSNIGENRMDLSGDFDERMVKVCNGVKIHVRRRQVLQPLISFPSVLIRLARLSNLVNDTNNATGNLKANSNLTSFTHSILNT